MDQARMDRAMSRIESALARVERAAEARLLSAGKNPSAPDGALRTRVGSALAELDSLIESLEK